MTFMLSSNEPCDVRAIISYSIHARWCLTHLCSSREEEEEEEEEGLGNGPTIVTPQTFGLLYSTFAAVLTYMQGVQLSGGEVGKTDCVCLLFLIGRAVSGQRWRPIVWYLPAWVMNSSFHRRERVRQKQSAHNSFKFYCVPVAGCRFLARDQMQHTHSCTACSLQLNSLSLSLSLSPSLSPSNTHTNSYLSLSLSHKHTSFSTALCPTIHSFPASISSKLHSACTKLSFVQL